MKVIVIEACGLHLGYLGCYGNDWVATPNLDRLAAEGVVFEWHFADQPELDSVTPWHQRSVGTGRYSLPGLAPVATRLPIQPRVVQCGALTQFASDASSALATDEPWLWIEGPSLVPPWRLEDDLLEAYFDEDDEEEGLKPWRDPPLGLSDLDEAQVLRLQNTYAAVVTFFDAQLGAVLQAINGGDAFIIVTARSGLPLGEHGMIGAPKPRLHDELVHIPLLMRLPGGAQAGCRVSALTQPLDLLPTILETLSSPIPDCDGKNLWPWLRGEKMEVRPFAFSALRASDEECWLMRSPYVALHLPTGDRQTPGQLFVKPEDRWEVNDLWQQRLETGESQATSLREFAHRISCSARPAPSSR